jgi:hypothetical protein
MFGILFQLLCAGSSGNFAFEFSLLITDADVFSGERDRERERKRVRACMCVTRHSSVLILLIKYTLISVLFLTCLFDLAMWLFHVTKYEFIPAEVTPALYYLISQYQYCRYYGCVNRWVAAIAGRLHNAEKTVSDG